MHPTKRTTHERLNADSSIRMLPSIGRRTAALLEHTGVRTIAQLAAVPDYFLMATFGPSLRPVRRQAQAIACPLPSHRPPMFGGLLASIGAWLLFRQLAR